MALDRRTISKEPSRSAGALSADEGAPRLAPILTGPFGRVGPSHGGVPSGGGVLLILFPLDDAKAPAGDKEASLEAEVVEVPD